MYKKRFTTAANVIAIPKTTNEKIIPLTQFNTKITKISAIPKHFVTAFIHNKIQKSSILITICFNPYKLKKQE